ncbi:T9SS type A sorting domain-containing protein [Psychroserpens sp.]|uniref:T9SS type A sorting domain-containing protein n=1 Tax=Psychroserpens sp. TaxID=2020870 RepID=UPI002B27525C|nr:T9SS type A sorting domain-containing protein [Psychroserpens sp.]
MRQLNFFLLLAFLSFNINAQNTFVPDDNFEQALIDLGYDSGALDNNVPTVNINTITYLNVSNNAISDLTGIEDFTTLTSLDVSSNNLTSLDVSNNLALEILQCFNNSLTNLDVSNNIALELLNCHTNNITYLSLVNNLLLETLYCLSNELTGINLKNGNNTIITYFNALLNPNLACIQVEDATYSEANWTFIDVQTSFSDNCFYNSTTYVPDDNFEQALIDLGYDSGPLDDYVPTININTVTSLDVNAKAISDLTGIEDFTELTTLGCNFNNLTNIDLSNNINLLYLGLSNNNIASLDLSNNTALKSIACNGNTLTRLNLVNNQALLSLDCRSNQLFGLNVKNGNNTKVFYFNATNNPDLSCIQVDDAAYSGANWTNIDPTSSFRRNCRYVATYGNRFSQDVLDSKKVSFSDEKLSIYPNPVNSEFTISLQSDALYSIFNMNGQKLLEGRLVMGENHLNISQLQTGMYFLHVVNDGVLIQKKLIKQ